MTKFIPCMYSYVAFSFSVFLLSPSRAASHYQKLLLYTRIIPSFFFSPLLFLAGFFHFSYTRPHPLPPPSSFLPLSFFPIFSFHSGYPHHAPFLPCYSYVRTRCVSNKTFPTKLHKNLAIILKIYIKNKKIR